MITQFIAAQIIESLRRGLPPQRGTQYYAVGQTKLINGVKNIHLSGIADKGIIRFVSGSWGSGKTHFFRLMRELAFDANCLVSNVELNKDEAPLNKFEKVFYAILKNIISPTYFHKHGQPQAAPFGIVLKEAMIFLATGKHSVDEPISHHDVVVASEKLMACGGIDIDFRKIVKAYWETFLPDSPDEALIDQRRDELLQWFSGDGTIGRWRKSNDVNKVVSKDNARLMLLSLSEFIKLAGYQGLVILFDEAEMSYSVMRKSTLKEAHNNLLHLINNVDQLTGLFLLYATTPDFYTDPKHGIVISGALQTRIGKPEEREPSALDTIWNLNAVQYKLEDYQEVGRKIRELFAIAYPGSDVALPSEIAVNKEVAELHDLHPQFSQVRFWRVLTSTLVRQFGDAMDGETQPVKKTYRDVMEVLKEL